jgi:hypothetical protein
VDDEVRVEVELDDADQASAFLHRLRSHELDDQGREGLGRGVMVSRDESRLFLYTATDAQARSAERLVRDLAAADDLRATIAVTRWHPVEEAWKDASLPLPRTPEQEAAEYSAREAAEVLEAEAEGRYDWSVVAHLPEREQAVELAERLAAEGVPASRRWRYVVAGAVTEERANELAERLGAELGPDADVRIDVDLSDLPRSGLQYFQFLPF